MHHTLLRKELGMLKAVIGTNGRGESDTLTMTVYATLRPVLDSIVPAVVQRGATIGGWPGPLVVSNVEPWSGFHTAARLCIAEGGCLPKETRPNVRAKQVMIL